MVKANLQDILTSGKKCSCGRPIGKDDVCCFICLPNMTAINSGLPENIRAGRVLLEKAINGMARYPGVNFIGNR